MYEKVATVRSGGMSMRIGEECPYLTPCKWCSKFDKPCDDVLKERKERGIDKKVRKSDER